MAETTPASKAYIPRVDDGGNAFPQLEGEEDRSTGNRIDYLYFPGMTLLDWFAGQALVGLMAQPDTRTCVSEIRDDLIRDDAKTVYAYAAAMIAEKRRLEKIGGGS